MNKEEKRVFDFGRNTCSTSEISTIFLISLDYKGAQVFISFQIVIKIAPKERP